MNNTIKTSRYFTKENLQLRTSKGEITMNEETYMMKLRYFDEKNSEFEFEIIPEDKIEELILNEDGTYAAIDYIHDEIIGFLEYSEDERINSIGDYLDKEEYWVIGSEDNSNSGFIRNDIDVIADYIASSRDNIRLIDYETNNVLTTQGRFLDKTFDKEFYERLIQPLIEYQTSSDTGIDDTFEDEWDMEL